VAHHLGESLQSGFFIGFLREVLELAHEVRCDHITALSRVTVTNEHIEVALLEVNDVSVSNDLFQVSRVHESFSDMVEL
jgi:hypothetical protein